MFRVLIAGGYGNFGGYVARRLAAREDIQLILAGRDMAKAQRSAASIKAVNPVLGARLDIYDPPEALAALAPDLVINIVGPYHKQDYSLACAAIACKSHYCDMSDARNFVTGITELDQAARDAGVCVLAGASTVPSLTAAYLDEAMAVMDEVHSFECGITGAEQANRGAGTVAAVLSYVGQSFTRLRDGKMQPVFGWADIHSVKYPQLGRRWFGNGDLPDLDLLPARCPSLRDQRFSAGHEITILHFGVWFLGLLRRVGLLPRLDRFAPMLLKSSKLFNWLGRGQSGFHLFIKGVGKDGSRVERRHWIIARSGDGPNIPCIPVILIAQKLAEGCPIPSGARPCMGLISSKEFHTAMRGLDHEIIFETGPNKSDD